MSRRALIACPLVLAACAEVLGGLEEGTARLVPIDASSDAGAAADSAPPPCRALAGYAYRVPIRTENHGPPIVGYQVRLDFPTDAWVAAGRMRADGRDLAVTRADGVTRVPHWLEGGVGTAKTTLWTRFDLDDTPIDGWLYFGGASAADLSSMEETFVQGVIANPYFDRDEGWELHREGVGPSTSSLQWSTRVGDGGVEVYLATPPHPNGKVVGLCQTVDPPEGRYRARFDLDVSILENAHAEIAITPYLHTDAVLTWNTRMGGIEAPAHVREIETEAFEAGLGSVCLRATSPGSTASAGVRATFHNLRLRRWLDGDRVAVLAGPEVRSCAP